MDVSVLNVAAVFPEVDRDPNGPAQLRLNRGPNRVRLHGPAGLPDCRYVVNVDTEMGHGQKMGFLVGEVSSDGSQAAKMTGAERVKRLWGDRRNV